MNPTPPDLRFPYMVFARERAGAARFPLTVSGMPAADPALLELAGPVDLGFAGAEALPALQAALGEHLGADPEAVVVTVGASSAMLAAALTLFGGGARVVCETPSYEPLRRLPDLLGAERAPLERRLEEGWAIDPERAARALAGAPGPGHLFLTNPHNPSGAELPAGTVRGLASAAAEAGGVLVVCEVYQEYLPLEERVLAHAVAPNTIGIGSLTKAYGLGALRLGWMVLGDGVRHLRRAVEDALFLTYVDPPTPILRMAGRAFENLAALRGPLRELDGTQRPRLARWLEGSAHVEATVPAHGLIAFPRVRGVRDTHALARHLLETEDVGVVPGGFFGAPGHLRIGCGLPVAELDEALERLERGLGTFRAR